MEMLVVTGCIIFNGQGRVGTNIIEVYDFHFIEEEDIIDFGDKYLDGGGDSFMEMCEDVGCSDKKALSQLTILEDTLLNEIRDIKQNCVLISSVLDTISRRLDLLQKWKYIFENK